MLYKLFATSAEVEELAARYRAGGMGDGTAKQMLLEKIEAFFGPFREKRKQLAVGQGLRRRRVARRGEASASGGDEDDGIGPRGDGVALMASVDA